MKRLLQPSIFFMALAGAHTAFALDFDPKLNGIISVEIQNDLAYDSDDPDAEANTLFTKTEPYLILSFNDRVALESLLTLEPVQDTPPGDDTIFDNEGLYVQELKLTYTGDHFGLFAGKYNPTFGTAWDMAPGVYGRDFAKDYQLTERIGFGGDVSFGSEIAGNYILTGNTFFLDTSGLSESIFTSRGNTDKSDGGVSNTEDFSSYSVTLDSESLAGLEGVNTHVGYYNQSNGDADTGMDHEKGTVISVNYTLPLSDDVEMNALGEWAGIRHAGGGHDKINYLTTSLGFNIYENWNFAASYTNRNTDTGSDDSNDQLYELSAGYTFENGMSFNIGYGGIEESGTDTRLLGALLAYVYEF